MKQRYRLHQTSKAGATSTVARYSDADRASHALDALVASTRQKFTKRSRPGDWVTSGVDLRVGETEGYSVVICYGGEEWTLHLGLTDERG